MEAARLTENRFRELGYSPTETVREFQQELTRETDLLHEGRSTDRFRRNFADDPMVRFPVVFWKTTTRRVLTLEHVQGTVLAETNFAAMSAEQRRQIVPKGRRRSSGNVLSSASFMQTRIPETSLRCRTEPSASSTAE